MASLYILFVISAFCPVYTYFIYPVFLKLMKGKEYEQKIINPSVTVIITGDNPGMKIQNVLQSDYEKIEVIEGSYDCVNKAKGEIFVFTDTKTELNKNAIREIVKPFADDSVGAVLGELTSLAGNSVFWKYETLIKQLESRIGCVSGANESLFAVRRTDMPEIPEMVLNKPFYIATKITENGRDIIFQNSAQAYEKKSVGTNFDKHVQDAAGYWQALKLYPKMLLLRHGSFVYISHRVMKWFVWFNIVTMLITSGTLALMGSWLMTVLFGIQMIVYAVVVFMGRMQIGGLIGKLIHIAYYFVMLNISYFIGIFR